MGMAFVFLTVLSNGWRLPSLRLSNLSKYLPDFATKRCRFESIQKKKAARERPFQRPLIRPRVSHARPGHSYRAGKCRRRSQLAHSKTHKSKPSANKKTSAKREKKHKKAWTASTTILGMQKAGASAIKDNTNGSVLSGADASGRHGHRPSTPQDTSPGTRLPRTTPNHTFPYVPNVVVCPN